MGKIAIVADSNCGISQQEGKELGIFILPMPFFVDGELYYDGVTLTYDQFMKRMNEGADISTTQPAPVDVAELWDKLLKDHEYILHIPMSSNLSSSYEMAAVQSREYEGKVFVVDNQRISVTQRQSVLDAITLREQGKSALEIQEVLEAEKAEAGIYVTVDTLKYLKKGGRVTPAAAALGTVLNMKPVLQLLNGKLDAFAKVRGLKAAKKTMLEAMEKELNGRFQGKEVVLQAAYSCSEEEAAQWKAMIEERFPGFKVQMDRLTLSIACHTGPGAIAVACSKKL